MKAPFVKVNVENDEYRDITHRIESFRFEEHIEKDNLVEIIFKETNDLELVNSEYFKTGTTFSFQFGYLGEAVSPVHTAKVTNVDVDYESSIKIIVSATCSGMALKKVCSPKIWKNMTASQIVEAIVIKHKLTARVDATTTVYKSLPQGNKSDFSFMKYLATIQRNGEFTFYTSGDKVHFVKRNLNKESSLTATYGQSKIIRFSPKLKEIEVPGSANEATAIGVDLANKKVNASQVNNTNVKEEVGLGDKILEVFNGNGDLLGKNNGKRPVGNTKPVANWDVEGVTSNVMGLFTGKSISVGSGDKSEVSSIANKEKKKATMMVMDADLEMEGNPLLKIDEILTMSAVATAHVGNYHMTGLVHTIAGGAYVTSVSMRKNAVKDSVAAKVATPHIKKNNTVGADKIKNVGKVERVYIYDGRADKIGSSTGNNKRPD